MPRPLHEEGGVPRERSFTTADVRWACRCATRVRKTEHREAEFLIECAEAIGKSLEEMARDCEMGEASYRYLERECAGDYKAMKGLQNIKGFRERVARIVRLEAYNRRASTRSKTSYDRS